MEEVVEEDIDLTTNINEDKQSVKVSDNDNKGVDCLAKMISVLTQKRTIPQIFRKIQTSVLFPAIQEIIPRIKPQVINQLLYNDLPNMVLTRFN